MSWHFRVLRSNSSSEEWRGINVILWGRIDIEFCSNHASCTRYEQNICEGCNSERNIRHQHEFLYFTLVIFIRNNTAQRSISLTSVPSPLSHPHSEVHKSKLPRGVGNLYRAVRDKGILH